MTYTIYRLKDTDPAEARRFMGSDFWQRKGWQFDRDLYEPIYTGEGLADLEQIYQAFQGENRPEDFRAYSLSVADVVELGGVFYFCDSFGWLELTEWRAGA